MSSELIREVRDELANVRAARYADQAVARAQANADFLKKQAAEKVAVETAERVTLETEKIIAKWKKTGKVVLIVGGIISVSYGVYKVTPKIKSWWNERKQHTQHTNEECDAA